MTKVDLVTGFLGSGKTTFIRKYAQYLISRGLHIGIIENDFGAVNVDMMLLSDLEGDNCELEMVSGGCDRDCHKRRFKTKLIALGMLGLDRVIVEPSGVYDPNEFFDALRDEPLDRFYEVGSVITIVDGKASLFDKNDVTMLPAEKYMLATQLSVAGCVLVSKIEASDFHLETNQKQYYIDAINNVIMDCGCDSHFDGEIVLKNWDDFDENDFDIMMNSGFRSAVIPRENDDAMDEFSVAYYMNILPSQEEVMRIADVIFTDDTYGKIMRLKGFIRDENDKWLEVNITGKNRTIRPVCDGQDVIIVIGKDVKEDRIRSLF